MDRCLPLGRKGFKERFLSISPNGTAEPLAAFDVNPSNFAISNSGSIAFVGDTTTQAPELWLSMAKARRTRYENQSKLGQRPVDQTGIPEYKSFDGTEIEGSLLNPPVM